MSRLIIVSIADF